MITFAIGQVTAHSPPRGLQMAFKNMGQSTPFPVQMSFDYADALRVRQKPLPGLGSWGLVAFPYGDMRNGIWLKAVLPSQMDALTYNNQDTDPFIDYEAHFSGYWRLLDGLGNQAVQWADGSYFTAASGVTLPVVMRQTVQHGNVPKRIPFTRGDRIPNPPSAYNFRLTHTTGTFAGIDVSGNVVVSGSPTAMLTMAFGGTTVTIDASGNTTVSGPSAANLNLQIGNALLTLSGGNFTAAVNSLVNLITSGASATDAAALVSKLVLWLSTHTHGGVSSGSAHTTTPDQAISATTIQSAVLKLSA